MAITRVCITIGFLFALGGCTAASSEPTTEASTVSLTRFQGEIDGFRAADAARPPAACQTLFVGSSSIRMWTDLADRFPFPTVRRGVGGSTLAEIDHYFGAIVAPYRPARIVLYAGENDLNEGRSVDGALADLKTFLSLKRQALGATPVYFVSAKPSPSRVADLARQNAFNAAAKALAGRERDLAYIDVATPMQANGAARPELFGPDNLHMKPVGYDLWTKVIGDALARPAESRAPGC